MEKDHNTNIIKASYRLQQKVGNGPVDEKLIKASQSVIDSNQVDFAPMGLALLKRLETTLQSANDPAMTMPQLKSSLSACVMELKANAATFHYTLISNLANIMLSFLETITVMDKDALAIVRAHHDTLRMIVVRNLAGDGGAAGRKLVSELQQVCIRYHNKSVR